MLANRVEETTATTGTGSFTTAGAATGSQTFNNAFGTNNRFTYWAVNDTDEEWETGVGYLSASTTLVRETITDNSAGGLTAINFTTAPTLFVGTSSTSFTAAPNRIADDLGGSHVKWVQSANMDGNGLATSSMVADNIYYTEFILEYGGEFTGIAQYISSAGAAGTEILLGIYDQGSDGRPGNLISENGITIDAASTGEKTSSFSANLKLPPGRYYAAVVFESAAIVARGVSRSSMTRTLLLSIQPSTGRAIAGIREAYVSGWTTPLLPTTGGAGAYTILTFEAAPTLYLVPA